MLRTTTDIKVDFYDKKYILINAKQLDRGAKFLDEGEDAEGNKYSRWIDDGSRHFSVTCYNHGEPISVNSGEHAAYIRYRKADGHAVYNFCEIDRYGKIIVRLTEQMLATEGICVADLVIISKGEVKVDSDTGEITNTDHTTVLSTMPIHIDVTGAVVENSDIESTYEFNLLNTKLEEYWANYEEVMKTSKSWAVGGTGIRDGENINNSMFWATQSENSADASAKSAASASTSASKAQEYMDDALKYQGNAYTYMNKTYTYMNKAEDYMDNASASATSAATSAKNAATSEGNASKSEIAAQQSMNFAQSSASSASTSATAAQGYLQQTEAIANGLNGAFSPKGTVTFAELLELKDSGAVGAGYLYHISDDFTTDENFRVSGKVCGAGTSVYYTVDGTFDVFVGATVAGVKGKNETEYRTGMVNITPENIGAISKSNDDIATVDEVKVYLGI